MYICFVCSSIIHDILKQSIYVYPGPVVLVLSFQQRFIILPFWHSSVSRELVVDPVMQQFNLIFYKLEIATISHNLCMNSEVEILLLCMQGLSGNME